MRMVYWPAFLVCLFFLGCATQRETHTARTGVEQLLVSSAVDRALDQFDFSALKGRKTFLESKYLDCIDKNYVLLSIRQRLANQGAVILDKADHAEVVVEVASGGVGTDGQELFVGIPEIPLPPPSPVAIPKVALLTRTKFNGTAKLLVFAYEVKSKTALTSGTALARSDQKNWNILGAGPMQTGSLPREIAYTTQEQDLTLTTLYNWSTGAYARPPSEPTVLPAGHVQGE